MSSQVFARKYRPQNFKEVVGQETVVRILENALLQKRFHHAYLFTGPRGTGKTSLARIYAKSLNCEKGPTTTPCQECASCREITEGRSLSVMEIDGASNTSVEDVRDIRDKIRYLPPGGRYKIYIIDEVHMLSTAAFNALLKTLEEPPAHAMFLFATTDPQKVLSTVLSRVIRFDLRPITISLILDHLKKVAQSESVQVDEDALFQIAREAQGGLRDALSLLDQIVSFSGSQVTLSSVESVLGVSTHRFVSKLVEYILNEDGAGVLQISEEAFGSGVDLKRLATDLLEHLRHLLVAQVVQDPSLFDLPPEELTALAALAKTIPVQDLDRLFRILQKGLMDLLRSTTPKILMDVLLLRLCHYKDLRSLDEVLKMVTNPGEVRAVPASLPTTAPRPVQAPPAKNWAGFLDFVKTKKPQLYPLIETGKFIRLSDKEIALHFSPEAIQTKLLQEPERSSVFEDLLKQFFERPLKVLYEAESRKVVEEKKEGATGGVIDDVLNVFGSNAVVLPQKSQP